MAGSSDKARFYLEQSVPELQELQRKKIFSKASGLVRCVRNLSSNYILSKKSAPLQGDGPISNISLMLKAQNHPIMLAMLSTK